MSFYFILILLWLIDIWLAFAMQLWWVVSYSIGLKLNTLLLDQYWMSCYGHIVAHKPRDVNYSYEVGHPSIKGHKLVWWNPKTKVANNPFACLTFKANGTNKKLCSKVMTQRCVHHTIMLVVGSWKQGSFTKFSLLCIIGRLITLRVDYQLVQLIFDMFLMVQKYIEVMEPTRPLEATQCPKTWGEKLHREEEFTTDWLGL